MRLHWRPQCLLRSPSDAATWPLHEPQRRRNWCLPRHVVTMMWRCKWRCVRRALLPMSATVTKSCQQQPRQNHRPCCFPPPPYIVIFGCSPQYQWGGGIDRRIQRRLPWRLQHHFPSSMTNHFGSATASNLVVALDIATILALPAL